MYSEPQAYCFSCLWLLNKLSRMWLKNSNRNIFFHSSVQVLDCVQFFATPWTAVRRASLSFTIFWSLFKLMSIESGMPSNHLILCYPLFLLPSVFPSIRVFSSSESLLLSGAQSIEASASVTVLSMNIQD